MSNMSNVTECAHLDLISAYRRLDEVVEALAFAKHTTVVATIAPGVCVEGAPRVCTIQLCDGKHETTVQMDYDALTEEDEFFQTLVVPQLEAAIAKLGTA